jgi:hypothetical protein
MKRLFGDNKTISEKYKSYDTKTLVPQYTPSVQKPHIDSLINIEKYSKLIRNINESSVSDEEKRFLKFAASRHIVFNYALIADYYANSNAEMQGLMEQSALVILDIDDAIANGYVKLSKDIRLILEQSGEIASK